MEKIRFEVLSCNIPWVDNSNGRTIKKKCHAFSFFMRHDNMLCIMFDEETHYHNLYCPRTSWVERISLISSKKTVNEFVRELKEKIINHEFYLGEYYPEYEKIRLVHFVSGFEHFFQQIFKKNKKRIDELNKKIDDEKKEMQNMFYQLSIK